MNKEYKIKLDLNKKLYNKKMTFNQFDENVNDFYIEVTKNNEVVKDLDKSIVTLVAIKPNNTVEAQFVEVENSLVYADLKPSMCDLVGNYQAKAMIVLEGEIVTTDTINYSVNEDKIISRLNEDVASDERFALFTDALARLSDIEASEEQRIVNEAERILAEENRKIEEAKRVEAELIRQHEEADRTKYDATRESNENIRKQNEEARISSENVRLENEADRIEQETNRVKAEQLRKDNYNFMTEDEERRRSEANAHKEAENLRVQAETDRVNEEAKRRTTEQTRVLAENTRVSNENTRKSNEIFRENNETQRIEAETQRQNRYNSFISDAEANANEFKNYTNTAKANEEERKANELDRKSQEDRRVSNEVERISNENTRKASEITREKNETSRQNTFSNKVSEVDKKIVEINATKDNLISSVTTKVDNKVSEIDEAKSDMTATISDKVNEVETRFNALTSSQQQDAEVIDARTDFKGEVFDSLKDRIDYTDKLLRESTVSTVETESDFTTVEATSNGYFEDVKLEGKTLVNLANKEQQVLMATSTTFFFSDYIEKTIIKPSTRYMIVLHNISDKVTSVYFKYAKGTKTAISNNFAIFTTFDDLSSSQERTRIHFYTNESCDVSEFSDVKYSLFEYSDIIQNPPSYFEGLKSVGEGTDEIVVSSVNENLFDINSNTIPTQTFMKYYIEYDVLTLECTNSTSNGFINYNLNNLNDGEEYIISFDCEESSISTGEVFVQVVDENGKHYNANTVQPLKFIPRGQTVLRFYSNVGTGKTRTRVFKNIMITKNNNVTYIPHQSDKKRLLFYNNETQTWEKPVLREWDSIEKHTDGKYYYHQRSGEVVLNGSEDWSGFLTINGVGKAYTFAIGNKAHGFDNLVCDKLPVISTFASDANILNGVSGTNSNNGVWVSINASITDIQGFKEWLQANNTTVVYQLAQEKVYECTNIDLITYANETNYIVESGAIVPRTTLKVYNNISNVVSLLQKKVSILESNMTNYIITQNRLMLTSRYNADTVGFKVDVASYNNSFEYDNDLYELILNNILVGKDNYDREYIENLIIFYWMDFVISDEMHSTLFEIIEEQHNPKVIEDEEAPL